ncbi:MAG TPA: IclR family transcriptional regulator [Solirubrobacteraceae bacterium]|nr:IclR family transcriptional regulator [Solirubrobacteraceae bacterium]
MSTSDSKPESLSGAQQAAANARERESAHLARGWVEPGWEDALTLGGEARYSQSLERGLAILMCFTRERPLLGIAELADMLGLSRSTTHRYAITLVALGYLRQGERRKYRLALHVIDLGMSAMNATSLREHARPYIEELSRRSTFTVGIAVLDGPELIYLDGVRGRRRGQSLIELGIGAGSRLPAHYTAMGKLLMAHLPARERRELIAQARLGRHGPGAVASKSALREQLEAIPLAGLATSGEELAAGLIAIAAPVRGESREVVAAAGMAAHSSMISLRGLVEELGPHLISTADRISARLGYRRADERAR